MIDNRNGASRDNINNAETMRQIKDKGDMMRESNGTYNPYRMSSKSFFLFLGSILLVVLLLALAIIIFG